MAEACAAHLEHANYLWQFSECGKKFESGKCDRDRRAELLRLANAAKARGMIGRDANRFMMPRTGSAEDRRAATEAGRIINLRSRECSVKQQQILNGTLKVSP